MSFIRQTVRRYRRPLTMVTVLTPLGLSLPDQDWDRQAFRVVNNIAPELVWRSAWGVVAMLLVLSSFGFLRRTAGFVAVFVVTAWVVAVAWAKVFDGANTTWGGIALWATYLAMVWLVSERPDE